jgi:hypothetical protein
VSIKCVLKSCVDVLSLRCVGLGARSGSPEWTGGSGRRRGIRRRAPRCRPRGSGPAVGRSWSCRYWSSFFRGVQSTLSSTLWPIAQGRTATPSIQPEVIPIPIFRTNEIAV